MKLKSRIPTGIWGTAHIRRRPSMPQFKSSLPGEFAADAVHQRCAAFRLAKRINKLARKHMTTATLQQIIGAG